MSNEKSVKAWASAQLREKLKNADTRNDKRQVLQDAGLLDEELIDFLIEFDEYFPGELEDQHYHAQETRVWKRMVRKNKSKNLRRAVKNEETSEMHHHLGVVEQNGDISDVQTTLRFSRWVKREAGVTYLAGHMGNGKTDFALLMGETFHESFKESSREVHVAANIQSCQQTDYISSQPELVEWLETTPGHKLFILDDGSDSISGYSGDSHMFIKQFKSIITFLRKYDGSLAIIGHSGKDVHPHIRRLADYVEKKGKKEAIVFEDVHEGEGQDKKFPVENIPATSWSYDTKEESRWEWASEDDEDEPDLLEIACKTYVRSLQTEGESLSQREVAKIFEISRSRISENYEKYM